MVNGNGDEIAPQPPSASRLEFLKYIGQPLAGLEGITAKHGDIVSVPIATENLCIVAHPDAVKQVFTTEASAFEKGHLQNQYLGTIVGDGLLLSEGEYWAKQRTKIQPAFDNERFSHYANSVADLTAGITDGWGDGDVIVVDEIFQELTLQILAKALFGMELGAKTETFSKTGRTISSRYDFTELSTFVPEWVPLPKHRRYHRAISEFDEALYDLIEDRRSKFDSSADGSPANLLSMLLPTCDNDTIRDEVATILLGGHDTSALAIAYTLYLVAKHPDIERRVRDELEKTIHDRTTMETIEQLEYTENVAYEAMRLYPPAYSVFREPTEAVEIGGYTINPGTTVVLPQWIVHRDERWWDEPEIARPERWEGEDDRPEYAYFPFSGGPRGCIGREFGMVEILVAVSVLLQNYDFSLVESEPLGFAPSLTLQPEGGLRMQVRSR
jgi:cytochrome P450